MSLSPRGTRRSSIAAQQALSSGTGGSSSRHLSLPQDKPPSTRITFTEARNPSSSSSRDPTIPTSSSASSSSLKPPPSPGGGKLRRRSPSTRQNAQPHPPLWSSGGGKSSSKTSSSNKSNSCSNHSKKEGARSNSAYLPPPSPLPDNDLRSSQLYQQQNVFSHNGPTVVELAAIGQGSSSSRRSTPPKSLRRETNSSRRSTPSSSQLESSNISGCSWSSITIQTDPGPVRRHQLSSLGQTNFARPTATTRTLNAEPLTIEIDGDSQDGYDGISCAENSTDLETNTNVAFESILMKDTSALLHALCSDATTPMDLWNGRTLVTTQAASQSDSVGRLPLHCLSQNKVMAEFIAFADANEQQHETDEFTFPDSVTEISPSVSVELDNNKSSAEGLLVQFVLKILRVYPSSMISQDGADQIPFEGSLRDWVEDAHEPDSKALQIGRSRTTSWDGPAAFWNRSMATIAGNNNSSTFGKHSTNHPDLSGTEGVSSCTKNTRTPLPPSGQLHTKDDLIKNNHISPKTAPVEWDRYFPLHTQLTAQTYFALKMLSAIVDYLDHRLKQTTATDSMRVQSIVTRPVDSQGAGVNEGAPGETLDSAVDQLQNMTLADVQSEIIHSVASIPHLLKVLLLMDDGEQQRFVFSTTIVKRVLASKDSIGTWLTGMLQSDDRYVSNRAIAYLKMVSEITQIEQTSMSSWTSGERGFSKFDEEDSSSPDNLTKLCHTASRLQGFVPSLLSLSEKQVEEAATTRLVKGVLDRIIATPFCSTIVMSDAIFLTILIAGYRAAINNLILGSAPDKVMQCIYVANTGIFYFIIRELGKAVSLCTITSRARTYFLSFWNLLDLLSTILVLVSVVAIRSRLGSDQAESLNAWRNTLAVTTGFLWLRVLNFLKGINMQLATFVLAILQITRDVLWFCVILVALVLAFGQMFFTLLAPNTCSTMEDGDISRECKQSEYYLKVYTLLISQEFEREDFPSVFSVILVVIYSFMVVLVLLNVLIAVASNSYEKCLFRSQNLFGRARVMMIAELVSFQNLLRRSGDRRVSASRVYKSWWSSDAWYRGWSRGSIIFLALSSVVIIVWVLGETIAYFSGPGYGNVVLSLASIFINVALFVGIMLFLSTSGATDAFDEKGVSSDDVGWRGFPQRIMLRLLGSSGGSLSAGAFHDSWKGRLLFLRDELKRISDETKADTDDKIKALEKALCEHIDRKVGRSTSGTSKNSLDESFKKL